jgi:hypothetical protein
MSVTAVITRWRVHRTGADIKRELTLHAEIFRGRLTFHSATTVANQPDRMRQAIISLALLALLASATATTAEPQAVSQGNDAVPVVYNRRMLSFGLFHPWFHHSKVGNSLELKALGLQCHPASVHCIAQCTSLYMRTRLFVSLRPFCFLPMLYETLNACECD